MYLIVQGLQMTKYLRLVKTQAILLLLQRIKLLRLVKHWQIHLVLVESIVKSINLIVADSIDVVESINIETVGNQALSDSSGVSEQIAQAFGKSLSDTASILKVLHLLLLPLGHLIILLELQRRYLLVKVNHLLIL